MTLRRPRAAQFNVETDASAQMRDLHRPVMPMSYSGSARTKSVPSLTMQQRRLDEPAQFAVRELRPAAARHNARHQTHRAGCETRSR